MRALQSLSSLFIVLAIWGGVSALELFPETIFPSPASVLVAAVDLVRDGTLTSDLKDSLGRACIGFLIGASLGVAVTVEQHSEPIGGNREMKAFGSFFGVRIEKGPRDQSDDLTTVVDHRSATVAVVDGGVQREHAFDHVPIQFGTVFDRTHDARVDMLGRLAQGIANHAAGLRDGCGGVGQGQVRAFDRIVQSQ